MKEYVLEAQELGSANWVRWGEYTFDDAIDAWQQLAVPDDRPQAELRDALIAVGLDGISRRSGRPLRCYRRET